MSEISKYEAYKKKLQGLCDEHNLIFKFQRNTYPVQLTIKPVVEESPQLMLDIIEPEDNGINPEAFLMFEFKDGDITYKTSKEFAISETLFNKIKNLFKNMHSCWMQHFFRNIIERELLKPGEMPEIDETDADDTDIQLPDGAERFEEALDDLADEVLGNFEIDVEDDIKQAVRIVRMENKASTSLLQRRLNVSEERTIEIMGVLEEMKVVGPYNDSDSREVLPYDEPADEDGVDNE